MKNLFFNRKVLFSLLAVVMDLGWTAMSYGQAVVSVEPAEVASPAAGEELTVSINIAGGADVAGFQVTVNFDAAALTYEAGAVGDYLPAGAFPIITPGDGSVTIAATAIGAAAAAADGTLATVTFTVVEAKASAITLTDILLSDAAANSLDVTSMDGAVTVTAAEGEAPVVELMEEPIDEVELIEGPSEEPAVAEESAIDGAVALGVVNAVVSVEPASVESPAVGEELMVSINIAGGADVAGFQVTVNFDATALTYEAGAVGDYLPAGAFPIITPDDGSVTIAATAIGAAAAAADGTLATVTFTVVEAKASAITLTDILLSDAAANSLDVTSMDGAVTVTAAEGEAPVDEIRVLTLSELPLMYWVDISSGRLFRSTRTTAENIVPNVQNATGIAMHAAQQKIYWMEKTGERSGKIRRANLDGSNVQLVKELTSVPRELTLDTVQNKLYLTNSWGKIQRMNFDGSGFQPNLITGLNEPKHLAVDISGGKVYWTEPGSIWRANLNGKSREQLLINLGEVGGITLANRMLYWTEQNKHNQTGRVRRATLTGSHVTTLATLMSVPMGIAVDPAGRRLYWTNSRGRIQRATLTGEHIQNVVTGLGMPASLVLGVAPEVGTLVAAPAVLGRVAVGKTGLLPNYPNPFNPETWIPYQLAETAEVTVTIHAADGRLVRTLALGQLPAGTYQSRSRAAYWDGRNAQGEPVASGIYFYTLQAGDFSATRKMVIRK